MLFLVLFLGTSVAQTTTVTAESGTLIAAGLPSEVQACQAVFGHWYKLLPLSVKEGIRTVYVPVGFPDDFLASYKDSEPAVLTSDKLPEPLPPLSTYPYDYVFSCSELEPLAENVFRFIVTTRIAWIGGGASSAEYRVTREPNGWAVVQMTLWANH